ncbi:putative spermidine synthase with an N-terminal membrane domain [Desulfomonile tiedjei DSM 6799]|uniref:Putative spermidine synthase with an N-terminal membrane domain n=2 Tax=Desulfomonile tiedjei TaxID=2358 RepID=I4C588_DESTA|nr:putative spermidine synthase with an N-terminal membrane domain [Desulfomonile tiedjei DSM 6799]
MLCLIFFLSGAAALIFETLWFRLAGLTFGNSVWAGAVVLSSFMAGIALGNGLAAVRGRNFRNPIGTYAFAEVAVAVSGLALVLALPFLTGWFVPLFRPFVDNPLVINPLRLFLAFILMLIPATAMGVTLPLMVKALHTEGPHFGRVLGLLYGLNTLGAVAGAVAAEMYFIGMFGIRGTGIVACVTDLFCAASALMLSRNLGKSKSVQHTVEASPPYSKGVRFLMAGFLSGALFLALEIIWFRFLVLFINAHSLAFAIMLALVLSGIGLGGLIASLLFRFQWDFSALLPAVSLLTGAVCVLTYGSFGFLAQPGSEYFSELSNTIYYSFPLVFPVSLLSGILFTMAADAAHRKILGSIETTGRFTLANTLGATLGSLLGGFVLLPLLGMEKSFFIIALGYGILTLLVLPERFPPGKNVFSLIASTALFLVCILLFPFGSMQKHLHAVGERLCGDESGWRMAAVREGLTETSQYWQKGLSGSLVNTRLFTNNHAMSSTELLGKRYMNFFVYFPVALHADPKDALLICFGVGSTAKALSDTKSLQSITVVDISKDILEGSRVIFRDDISNPLNDPRVRVHVEDGRFFLQTTTQRFDVITGEPPPPWLAGVVNLYSQEYFQLIHDSLKEGGIATYWLPVAQLGVAGSKSVLKAFCNVFENCTLWTGIGFEWIMVGTRGNGAKVSEKHFAKQWEDPLVGPSIRYCGFEVPEQLGTAFLMDASHIKEWTKDRNPVVDNFPKRIFGRRSAEDPADSLESAMEVSKTTERFQTSKAIGSIWPDALVSKSLDLFEVQQFLNELFLKPVPETAIFNIETMHRILKDTSLRFPILWAVGGSECAEIDTTEIRNAPSREKDSELVLRLAAHALANRNFTEAERYFAELERLLLGTHATYYRIYALCLAGKPQEAMKIVEDNAGLFKSPVGAHFLRWLKDTFYP